MESQDLNKLFKEKIATGKPYAPEAEESGKSVWQALEIHMPAKNRTGWLGYAAAVLVLLLGGSIWFFYQTIAQRDAQIMVLQKQAKETAQLFAQTEQQSDEQQKRIVSLENKLTAYHATAEIAKQTKKADPKVRYVVDTVFVTQKADKQPTANAPANNLYRQVVPLAPVVRENEKPKLPAKEADRVRFVLAKDGMTEPTHQENRSMRFRIGSHPQAATASKTSFALTFKF